MYMQSSLLQIHCFLGTARGAPARTGRGTAISWSLSGEVHCGQVGVGVVIVVLWRGLSIKSPNVQGLYLYSCLELRD